MNVLFVYVVSIVYSGGNGVNYNLLICLVVLIYRMGIAWQQVHKEFTAMFIYSILIRLSSVINGLIWKSNIPPKRLFINLTITYRQS